MIYCMMPLFVSIKDRHTAGYQPPVKDNSQDWHLLHGEENDFGTVLKFVRRIATCDNTDDIVIQVCVSFIFPLSKYF